MIFSVAMILGVGLSVVMVTNYQRWVFFMFFTFIPVLSYPT